VILLVGMTSQLSGNPLTVMKSSFCKGEDYSCDITEYVVSCLLPQRVEMVGCHANQTINRTAPRNLCGCYQDATM
jgi:hypothetical protein